MTFVKFPGEPHVEDGKGGIRAPSGAAAAALTAAGTMAKEACVDVLRGC